MSYKVHRLEVSVETGQHDLQDFLNALEGEVVSIIPNYARTSLFQIYGLTAKTDFVLIVEKTD